MKIILLTKKQVTMVDDEDFDYLNQWKWNAHWNKNTNSYYAVRSSGPRNKIESFRMNRTIMNTPKGMICDHINHNTLDNRKENLRNVTPSQSSMNRRTHSNNKFGEKCISSHGYGFRVIIQKERKIVIRKTYKNLEDAIKARDIALVKYHGEFGHLPEKKQQ